MAESVETPSSEGAGASREGFEGPRSLSLSERERLWRRLHAAAALIPLGAFFLAHLWINARALQGAAPYQDVTLRLQRIPALLAVEVLFVYAPLAFHVGFSAWLVLTRKETGPRGPGDRPWARTLQRLTGAVALVFLVVHFAELRFPLATHGLRPADFYPLLGASLSEVNGLGIPVSAAGYLAGLAAVSYHFAGGTLGLFFTFDWARTEARTRVISAFCTGLGVATFLVGADTVVAFATGASWPGDGERNAPANDVGTLRMGVETPR